jgi:hypothetical protein
VTCGETNKQGNKDSAYGYVKADGRDTAYLGGNLCAGGHVGLGASGDWIPDPGWRYVDRYVSKRQGHLWSVVTSEWRGCEKGSFAWYAMGLEVFCLQTQRKSGNHLNRGRGLNKAEARPSPAGRELLRRELCRLLYTKCKPRELRSTPDQDCELYFSYSEESSGLR